MRKQHAIRNKEGPRPLAAVLRLAAVLLMFQFAVTGCATPQRLAAVPANEAASADLGLGQIRYLVARDPSAFVEAGRISFRREQAWLTNQGRMGPLPPANFLAISGGGDDGAFTAGLLNGWTKHGDRPEFKAVTGVSTGALIAPFAFLGPRYDDVLAKIYTGVSQKDIFRKRNVFRAFFGDALADTTPLLQLTGKYVNRRLLDEIAANPTRAASCWSEPPISTRWSRSSGT